MLIAEPTKHGAGIAIYGDYVDLRSLHECIHELAVDPPLNDEAQNYLMSLASQIRHAYQGDREKKIFSWPNIDDIKYLGVRLLWPAFLFELAMLRWSAAFQPTSKNQQAHLYQLEFCAENALEDYDAETGRQCVGWLRSFSGVTDNFLLSFVTYCSHEYLYHKPARKSRFSQLPRILSSMHELSQEYIEFKEYVDSLAKERGCESKDMSFFQGPKDWPKFKW